MSAPLTDGTGITFGRSDDGWRFHSWHRSEIGAPALPPPPVEECERCFATSDEALAHFRQRYAGPASSGD